MLQSFSLAKHPSDIRLSGQVIYVGHSSIECVVRMEQLSDNGRSEKTVMLGWSRYDAWSSIVSDIAPPLLGRFSMVARDAVTHKARAVNPLILSTPEERALFKFGEGMPSSYGLPVLAHLGGLAHKARKKVQSMTSLHRVPPSQEEARLLHETFLKYSGKFANSNTK
jgi:acyl-coenzyme A thioesterase 9